jgi:hypothetical protein
MHFSKNSSWMILGAAALVSFSVGCGSSAPSEKAETPAAAPKPAGPPPAPKVPVSKDVKAKADAPTPGPKAKKVASFSSVGKGKAVHSGGGHDKSDYVAWTEEIDLADDGTPVETDVAQDNKHKVLYVSRERSFACSNGNTADGAVLMAVYEKGNGLGKPPGSGWFVAELDAGECAVPRAGLYGCKFDADGNTSQCGAAAIREDADDIDVTEVTESPASGPGK